MIAIDTFKILLVEDNMDDAGLTIRALKKSKLTDSLAHAQDGEEALALLDALDGNDLPRLILLDLKMPRMDGLELLRRLKASVHLRFIPVVMLTSSKEEQDIAESYKLGANAYIVKPVDFDAFSKTVADLGFFWMILNETPKVMTSDDCLAIVH